MRICYQMKTSQRYRKQSNDYNSNGFGSLAEIAPNWLYSYSNLERLHYCLLMISHSYLEWIYSSLILINTLYALFFFIGRPQPEVRWMVNGVLVDDQYEHNTGDVIENRLLWPSVQRTDLNSIFTCQAINTQLVEPRENSYILDLHCKCFYKKNSNNNISIKNLY